MPKCPMAPFEQKAIRVHDLPDSRYVVVSLALFSMPLDPDSINELGRPGPLKVYGGLPGGSRSQLWLCGLGLPKRQGLPCGREKTCLSGPVVPNAQS